MTATSIEPLRKSRENGQLYERCRKIEAKLVEISALTRKELSACCAIEDSESTGYLPSECLLHLLRQHRSMAFDECAEALFKTLMGRVLSGLPQPENSAGTKEDLFYSNVRDEAWSRFLEMLMKDRQEYIEGLDFYEVRFAKTLKSLRIDAQRKVYRKEKPLKSIDDPETGETAEKVEHAAGSFHQINWQAIADCDSLLRLEEAIDALPELQKAIIEMERKEIPVESKEPGVVNMSHALGKTPKTIRTHRKKAYETLHATLTKGEPR
jgi:hypothetical protein